MTITTNTMSFDKLFEAMETRPASQFYAGLRAGNFNKIRVAVRDEETYEFTTDLGTISGSAQCVVTVTEVDG